MLAKMQPEYHELARVAKVEGTVRLDVVIGKDGTVQSVKVISGHPLLLPTVEAALRKWRYQPIKMNGDAVDVVTSVDINFKLQP